jgi:diguanylate cyclase (GGDEF)-like protein
LVLTPFAVTAACFVLVAGGLTPFWPATLAALTALAAWSAWLAIVHRRSERATRRYRLLGEVSAEVNRAVLLNEDEEKIFLTILDYALRILDYVNLGTVLKFDDSGSLVIAASRGFDEAYVRKFRVKLEDTWQYRQTGGQITDALIVTPQTILKAGHKFDDWTWEYRSVISTPLFIGGQLYGLLNVDSYRENTFREEDVEVMRWLRAQIEVCLLARDLYRTALAQSKIDGLTKFLSRSTFDERFLQTLEHADRYHEVFTLGMFDVDGLKKVNDRHGHFAGDQLLAAISDAIRQTARKSDVLGRYGGDEFVALFHNTDAQAMSERSAGLLEALAASPLPVRDQALTASFCFGFADYPADGRTFEELVAVADHRLYRMKESRKTGR